MIINLTQHKASKEQLEAGVIDLPQEYQAELKTLITFNDVPNVKDMQNRAERLATMVKEQGGNQAMIGGAGYFMPHLENALNDRMISPLHAFSERVSVEVTKEDGTVEKVNQFRHKGFVDNSRDYSKEVLLSSDNDDFQLKLKLSPSVKDNKTVVQFHLNGQDYQLSDKELYDQAMSSQIESELGKIAHKNGVVSHVELMTNHLLHEASETAVLFNKARLKAEQLNEPVVVSPTNPNELTANFEGSPSITVIIKDKDVFLDENDEFCIPIQIDNTTTNYNANDRQELKQHFVENLTMVMDNLGVKTQTMIVENDNAQLVDTNNEKIKQALTDKVMAINDNLVANAKEMQAQILAENSNDDGLTM